MFLKPLKGLLNLILNDQIKLFYAISTHKKNSKKAAKNQSAQSQWLDNIRLK